MDNAQKAIMIGVGLFITIIVIAAVMLITGVGQDLLNNGTQQLTGISESLRVQVTDQYDGKVFTASQVRTACIDLLTRYQNSEIEVYVGDEQLTNGITDTNIPPNGTQKYDGTVEYVSTTGVAKIIFTVRS